MSSIPSHYYSLSSAYCEVFPYVKEQEPDGDLLNLPLVIYEHIKRKENIKKLNSSSICFVYRKQLCIVYICIYIYKCTRLCMYVYILKVLLINIARIYKSKCVWFSDNLILCWSNGRRSTGWAREKGTWCSEALMRIFYM